MRRVDDIVDLKRVARDMQYERIYDGDHSRFVSPNMSEDNLLPNGFKERIKQQYIAMQRGEPMASQGLCLVACAAKAWNSYHHELRQLQPFDWSNATKIEQAVNYMREMLPPNVVFDVRMSKTVAEDRLAHIRVDACNEDAAYFFVYGAITHGAKTSAAIAASIHPKRICILLNIKKQEAQVVRATHPDALLARITTRE